MTVDLRYLADYAEMNVVWDVWLNLGYALPRAFVQAALAKPEWRLEVMVVAGQIGV